MASVIGSNDAFTAFGNDVMVPKFERFRLQSSSWTITAKNPG